MSDGIDKVEYLKKKGPLPQYIKGIRVKKKANKTIIEINDTFNCKARGSSGKSPQKR